MKTRDRIIDQARRLFNEHGYGAVTTAALAQGCGIAEGNLWYHFKTKRALLDAIGERYAVAVEARLLHTPSGDPVAAYAALLGALATELNEFRFLYRDQAHYGEHAAAIARTAPAWFERSFVQVEAYLVALVNAGLLDWPRARLHDLATNIIFLLRYGLEHARELGKPVGRGGGGLRRTLRRHLTLFDHALDPAAADRLRSAIERIGDGEAIADAA
ncbi:MAG: TetR/AcrR family transcriptional regulator [Novosphingobium sp.]